MGRCYGNGDPVGDLEKALFVLVHSIDEDDLELFGRSFCAGGTKRIGMIHCCTV